MRRIALLLTAFLLVTYVHAEEFKGYKLIEKRFVKEVNADCYYLEHIKTGARIFKIITDDPNKTFSIGFKTLPEDNCGTAHILEHSVLNGSKNFPVKSPFDVLAKGSLNTFLNAMTSKDRTVYPAASLNEKDYFNLMNVYFDAVFFPLIYDDPMILQQEGWHYELAAPEDPLTLKGVVYNEMKGAFSSPERYLFYYSCQNLFPDNTYGFTSGGYPDYIPDLTQEKFINFHKKYYHPSNSYIFLYGNADMEKELAFIDESYLSHFDHLEIDTEVALHAPLSEMKEVTKYYSVPEGSNTENQTYLALTFVIGEGTDKSLDMSLDILCDVLVNQESAPVRLALQEAGIGSDVYAFSYALRQNYTQIVVNNANVEDAEKAKEIIFNTLQKAVDEGLDKEAVEGTINRMEFRLREGDDANKGIRLSNSQMVNWTHEQDPFAGLEYEKPLADVKTSLTSDYLEKIIKTGMIDNNYKLFLTLAPKAGLEGERVAKLEQELAEYKSTLSEDEINEIIASTEALLAKQNKEDSPEALATIPMLSLEDINPESQWYEVEEKKIGKNTVLHYNEFTNSILYARLIFDLRVLPEDLIPWLGLYNELISKLNTENYSYADLEKALKIHTGGYNTSISAQLNRQDNMALIPHFKVGAKVTMDKVDKLLELTEEILLHTDFSDTARIRTVLTTQHARLQAGIKGNGFGFALRRLNSYTSTNGLFGEMTKGIEYYWFLNNLLNDYESNASLITEKMETISKLLLTRDNMDLGIICTADEYKQIEKKLSKAIKTFPSAEKKLQIWNLDPTPKNEGFMAASKVQYVVEGANFLDLGYDFTGTLLVLNKVISSDWLHKEVRVKGGAYGGFAYFIDDGRMFLGSYRDPNLAKTLEVYKQTPEFIKTYETDRPEMVRSIIGTIADLDYPMPPSVQGDEAISHYYSGRTKEATQKIRDEVLAATVEDIKAMAPLVQAVIDANTYCVYGNQEIIEQEKELFESVRTIVE